MKGKQDKTLTRRGFMGTAAAVAAFTVVPRQVLGGPRHVAPSDKLNIAGIGLGGRGEGDLDECGSENIVALCDVDEAYDGPSMKVTNLPEANKYIRDEYREGWSL